MGMYALIEDAMYKRLEELIASGKTEDEAREVMMEEQEKQDARDPS